MNHYQLLQPNEVLQASDVYPVCSPRRRKIQLPKVGGAVAGARVKDIAPGIYLRPTERTCIKCGCTDSHACEGGCHWVEQHPATPTGLCSTCAPERAHPTVIVLIGPPACGKSTLASQLTAAGGNIVDHWQTRKLTLRPAQLKRLFARHPLVVICTESQDLIRWPETGICQEFNLLIWSVAQEKIRCPHCGAVLLWSEDRGPHCDGCDKFNP